MVLLGALPGGPGLPSSSAGILGVPRGAGLVGLKVGEQSGGRQCTEDSRWAGRAGCSEAWSPFCGSEGQAAILGYCFKSGGKGAGGGFPRGFTIPQREPPPQKGQLHGQFPHPQSWHRRRGAGGRSWMALCPSFSKSLEGNLGGGRPPLQLQATSLGIEGGSRGGILGLVLPTWVGGAF